MTFSRPAAILKGSTPDKRPFMTCDGPCKQRSAQAGGVWFGSRFLCAHCLQNKLSPRSKRPSLWD